MGLVTLGKKTALLLLLCLHTTLSVDGTDAGEYLAALSSVVGAIEQLPSHWLHALPTIKGRLACTLAALKGGMVR